MNVKLKTSERMGVRYSLSPLFFFLIVCCFAVVSCSQEDNVLLPEGNPEPVGIVVMNAAAESPNVILDLSKITWDNSNVYRAMYNRKPIAEVCKEYISTIDRQAIVIYPTDVNGVADLTQGFVAQVIGNLTTGVPDAAKIHGGSVAFSLSGETTTCNYTAGTLAAVKFVYVSKTRDIGPVEEATFVAYTILDNDPNKYGVVKIGTQYWMRENLKATYYWDDTEIPDSYDNGEYGRLYSWDSMNGEVIIDGWHMPNNSEWYILGKALGGQDIAGEKMKSTTGWNPYNGVDGNGTNSSGFNALPGGGKRISTDSNLDKGSFCWWWSSSERYPYFGLYHSHTFLYGPSANNNDIRFSVRCVRD